MLALRWQMWIPPNTSHFVSEDKAFAFIDSNSAFGKKGIRSPFCHGFTSSNSVSAPCKLAAVNIHNRSEKEFSSSAPKLQCRVDYLNYSQLLHFACDQKKTIIKWKKKEKYLQDK